MNGNRSVDLTVQTLHNTNDFITRIQVRDVEQVMYNCDANKTNEKTETEKSMSSESGSKIIFNYLMNIMSIRTKSENVHKKSIQLEEKKRKSRQKQNQQRYEREENERKRKKLENEEIKKKKMQQERALNHYLFRMMSGTADQLDDSFYKVFGDGYKPGMEKEMLKDLQSSNNNNNSSNGNKNNNSNNNSNSSSGTHRTTKSKDHKEEEGSLNSFGMSMGNGSGEEELWWEQRRSKMERMQEEKDRYVDDLKCTQTLGVEMTANVADIQAAFKKLSKKARNKDEKIAGNFKAIHEAYERLLLEQ